MKNLILLLVTISSFGVSACEPNNNKQPDQSVTVPPAANDNNAQPDEKNEMDERLQVYYVDAVGKTGYELKSSLSDIISQGHQDRGYGALKVVYLETDRDNSYDIDEENPGLVDMYSENPDGADPFVFNSPEQACGGHIEAEGHCFNREHLMPQSIFYKKSPMRNDFFHVYPSDGIVNRKRSNYAFGEVESPEWVSQNGSKVGPNTTEGFSGKVFEPIDEFKGDIARAMLYVATRYENREQLRDGEAVKVEWKANDMTNGTDDQFYQDWFLAVLLKWHKQDPVSAHEKQRNEAGYEFQGNRNPFIDNPAWVGQIWAN